MEFYRETEAAINNEKDYSNIVPTAENIAYLVQYCEQVYNQLLKLFEEDELKNEKLRYDLKTYEYKNCFGTRFEVVIKGKNYNDTITCKNLNSYIELYNSGKLSGLTGLDIYLELNYKTGSANSMVEHSNLFAIKFKPYETTFNRKSNFKNFKMEQIENNINGLLKKFPVTKTIFTSN